MCCKKDLRKPFETLWANCDPFEKARALDGQVFRAVKNRRTIRFEVDGTGYFMKYHGPVAWREILKNIFQFKLPVLGATNEYDAIRLLESLNIDTMKISAYAVKGWMPAGLHSFLITEELKNRISLEDFCRNWKDNPPDPALKHALIRNLADVCSLMHNSGLNHRDCYLCHFLLNKELFNEGKISLTVLDLHRAQIRKQIPRRMRIKDLAGIFFSSMDLGLNKRDALRFIAEYEKRRKLSPGLWRSVLCAAGRLYRKEYGRACPYEI
jgi:heptose I phosphotransferase